MRSAVLTRAARMEWLKLRTVRSTAWAVAAAVAGTVLLSILVCSSVDTSGGSADCPAGAPGCVDEDVVLNSLAGVYLGQIAVVAVAGLAATSEYASGTITATFLAVPRRRIVLLAKAGVVAGLVGAVGVVASVVSFSIGQPILHGSGFVPDNGYPTASLLDEPTARAIAGTAAYLAVIALFSLGVATMLRRSGAAIGVLLGVLYVPTMTALALPDDARTTVQKLSPMTAGLSVQRTIERTDSVPISPWAGLGVTCLWAAAAMAAAAWLDRRRDA
jgi:ABC-2 type transport system permease protein